MAYHRNHFKCRCMTFYDQRITGMDVMSGTWKVHTSIIQLIYPKGLHRTYYRVNMNKLQKHLNDCSDSKEKSDNQDDCFEKVIYRYNQEARGI